jgi:hypothetical protein
MTMTIDPTTSIRPHRMVLTVSSTINMPAKVRPQRVALIISPTVNMPKGMLRIK